MSIIHINRAYSLTGAKSSGIPFSRQECIDQLDSGLYSVQGAQAIISAVTSRRIIKKLILGHNELGDSGCLALFQFLSSDIGRRYEINEISLNSNHIGDRGLAAIATYLHGNTSLKELFLQNNEFTGDPIVCTIFSDAVNASQLEALSLTSNQRMSDAFIEVFLPALTSDHLRALYLSTLNITRQSLPHFRDYLSSKRCKLSILHCNGNYLGFRAIFAIIRAAEQHNFSLTSLELHSNRLMDVDSSDDDSLGEELRNRTLTDVWKDCDATIKHILARNEQLGRETHRQALELLRHARTILLHTQGRAGGRSSHSLLRATNLLNVQPSQMALLPADSETYRWKYNTIFSPSFLQFYLQGNAQTSTATLRHQLRFLRYFHDFLVRQPTGKRQSRAEMRSQPTIVAVLDDVSAHNIT